MSQPKKNKEDSFSDSTDIPLYIIDDGWDNTIRPITDPVRRADLERVRQRYGMPPLPPPADAPKPDDTPPSP